MKGKVVIPDVLRWNTLAMRYGEIFNIFPSLILAFIRKESSGNPGAYHFEPNFWDKYLKNNPLWKDKNPQKVSASYGLMQPLYITAWEFGYYDEPEGLFKPEASIYWGLVIFNNKLKRYDYNIRAAIAAYNTGSAIHAGGLEKIGGGKYFINEDYIQDIEKAWRAYAAVLKE